MHIVVIACSTEVYPFFPSKMCLVVPYALWVCYTPFEVVIVLVQSQNLHNMGSKCVWTSPIFFEEKMIGPMADKEENGTVSNNNQVDIKCAQCPPVLFKQKTWDKIVIKALHFLC